MALPETYTTDIKERFARIVSSALGEMSAVGCPMREYHQGLRDAIDTLQTHLERSINCHGDPHD